MGSACSSHRHRECALAPPAASPKPITAPVGLLPQPGQGNAYGAPRASPRLHPPSLPGLEPPLTLDAVQLQAHDEATLVQALPQALLSGVGSDGIASVPKHEGGLDLHRAWAAREEASAPRFPPEGLHTRGIRCDTPAVLALCCSPVPQLAAPSVGLRAHAACAAEDVFELEGSIEVMATSPQTPPFPVPTENWPGGWSRWQNGCSGRFHGKPQGEVAPSQHGPGALLVGQGWDSPWPGQCG